MSNHVNFLILDIHHIIPSSVHSSLFNHATFRPPSNALLSRGHRPASSSQVSAPKTQHDVPFSTTLPARSISTRAPSLLTRRVCSRDTFKCGPCHLCKRGQKPYRALVVKEAKVAFVVQTCPVTRMSSWAPGGGRGRAMTPIFLDQGRLFSCSRSLTGCCLWSTSPTRCRQSRQ